MRSIILFIQLIALLTATNVAFAGEREPVRTGVSLFCIRELFLLAFFGTSGFVALAVAEEMYGAPAVQPPIRPDKTRRSPCSVQTSAQTAFGI